ncbi:uncharacterized protein CPUR_04951 [Claviceps purpurea 20.1]|uniref:Yeast cell wall synthesis Kre9/Knh1-like N-terminal domain-containing protein n=1 Tax=Claviceps purpurea (strain 20.1) TaxID=1111077 RepID=M1W7K6_CLAP2|nr:hypothetical protein E4U38_008288 [Claviceps purpurea]CCE31100.1 uncharacterized protein CPUR_04951 [Claviceps purpurea 20.1]KAG6154091.1 hypothetical protein E4U37_002417 [Claviceps purpurea]KAG6168097.1 hypothetical protein E4U51_002480 [Claviceps purpurea]KAG6185757.1 hypothetical protein E4U27_000338 [Claviceps purpurea]
MRFSAAAVLAFAASALAQTPDFDPIYTPKKDEVVAAGSPLVITWDAPAKYASGTVSISLIGGPTQNSQQPIAEIASGVKNSAKTYTWNVDASLGKDNVYGLVFKLESDKQIFQYSNPFHIKAAGDKASGSDGVTLTKSVGTKTVLLSSTPATVSTTTAPAAHTTTPSNSETTPTSFVTKTEEFTTTVPCTTNSANGTGAGAATDMQSAPTGSGSAPTASNPIMTKSGAISPVPTAGASSIRVGSFSIVAIAAACLLL